MNSNAVALRETAALRTIQKAAKGWKAHNRLIMQHLSLLKSCRIQRMSELPVAVQREAANKKGVQLEVASAAELESLRLWEQGDAMMYTREALEQRYANRSHKEVWKYLNVWWHTAMSHAGEDPELGGMPKTVYVNLYVRIHRARLSGAPAHSAHAVCPHCARAAHPRACPCFVCAL